MGQAATVSHNTTSSINHENLQAKFAPMPVLNLPCIWVFVFLVMFEDCSDICGGDIGCFCVSSLEVNRSANHNIHCTVPHDIPNGQHLPWTAILHIRLANVLTVLHRNSHKVEKRVRVLQD
jgi:hypothetical protein